MGETPMRFWKVTERNLRGEKRGWLILNGCAKAVSGFHICETSAPKQRRHRNEGDRKSAPHPQFPFPVFVEARTSCC
jgi:hypothetical protein